MLRRDKADELFSIAIKRYQKEKPNIKLTNSAMGAIWYSIYGVLCGEGEKAALRYVETATLIEEL